MLNRHFVATVQRLLQQFFNLPYRLAHSLVSWLLRQLFTVRIQVRQSPTSAGFILPTTVMLLVVVSLAVGAVTLRTYDRTQQITATRQQRVIYNIATPALDRARAKLEYLFQDDPRFPAGIPSEGVMNDLLLDGSGLISGVTDAYIFEDEKKEPFEKSRLDLDGDNEGDAAWSYRADTDEDGVLDATVAYSIILKTPRVNEPYQMTDASDDALAGRAEALQVRNAPLSGSRQLVAACRLNDASIPLEQGWFEDQASSAVLRKNLQVDVYVMPDDPNRTIATLEFQQDRQLDQGNKWGAWFRGDIDLSPGPPFNWNGAMHTEGSFLAAYTGDTNRRFTGYLVSSPDSCIYTPDASEITVANVKADPDQGIPEYKGQVIGSKGYSDTFGDDESIFHLHGVPAVTEGDSKVLLSRSRDSVKDDAGHGPSDYTLDPLLLATEGVSQARDNSIDYDAAYDETVWEDNPIYKEKRIYAQSEDSPYLDDFFRADDRFGPKPRYGDIALPSTKKIGDVIAGNLLEDDGLPDDRLTREDAASDDAAGVGLDGYWERRARQGGLRLIVGQRLELGDTFGWGGFSSNGQRRSSTEEPLKPWDGCQGSNNSNRCNEARHRLTLQDNLAAVQATAVYHASAGTDNDDTPAACLATTVHPGTPQTLKDSTIFKDLSTGLESFWTGTWFANEMFLSDFLTGEGTNGWEYAVHPDSALDNNTDVAIHALKNLAYYAGDPNGGAPSFPPVQDDTVHPYPDMAMWGDMSVLRRIFDERWSGGFANLSIADKATLRTAACTMGMLAYNIGYLDNLDYSKNTTLLTNLSNAITALSLSPNDPPERVLERLDNDGASQTIQNLAKMVMLKEQVERDRLYGFRDGFDITGTVTEDGFESNTYNGGSGNWTTDWVRYEPYSYSGNDNNISIQTDASDRSLRLTDRGLWAYRRFNTSGMTNPILRFKYRRENLDNSNDSVKIRIYNSGWNEFGEISGGGTDTNYQERVLDLSGFSNANPYIVFETSSGLGTSDYIYIDDVEVFDGTPYTSDNCKNWPNSSSTESLERLCTNYSKYPSLYSLLPQTSHDEVANESREGTIPAYLQTENANTAIQYRPIDLKSTNVLNAFALKPKKLDEWTLPHGPLSNGTNPNSNRESTIACVGTVCGSGGGNKEFEIPFKDTALFNGREKMAVRVLNLNVDLLRTSNNKLSGDFWLPNTGLIYTFREDAVREDEIVRPKRTDWANCDENQDYESNSNCRMIVDVKSEDSTDPPLNTSNLVSPKAVDYYPDPDRRPHGFRLIKGQQVNRGNNPRGMSFVSDNPVYVQGDFNLHQTNGCGGNDSCRLEEFTTKLNDQTFNNFYSRDTLDTRFARSNNDLWRPSEILTDAITIVSDNFCDGSMVDGWLTSGEGTTAAVTTGEEGVSTSNDYGCDGSGDRTSFLNFMRPESAVATSGWLHENPWDDDSPITVSRHGNPILSNGSDYADTYYERDDFSGTPNRLAAAIREKNTRVNAVMISGVVPMRENQGYGGLHNFPRFITQWATSNYDQRALNIAGAFFQLNFSNYATGPFDQDAWEMTQQPSVNTHIAYYYPPKRLWGYDVGLQYAQAGPIAQRFITPSALRSEFYSEPSANDPYMSNLCRAMVTEANGDPDIECST